MRPDRRHLGMLALAAVIGMGGCASAPASADSRAMPALAWYLRTTLPGSIEQTADVVQEAFAAEGLVARRSGTNAVSADASHLDLRTFYTARLAPRGDSTGVTLTVYASMDLPGTPNAGFRRITSTEEHRVRPVWERLERVYEVLLTQ